MFFHISLSQEKNAQDGDLARREMSGSADVRERPPQLRGRQNGAGAKGAVQGTRS